MFILLEAVGGVGRPVNHGEPASERAAPGRCAPLSGWAIMRIFCDVVSGGRTTVWTAPVNGLCYRFEIPLLGRGPGLYFTDYIPKHYRLYGL